VFTIAPSFAGYSAQLVSLTSESAAAFGQMIYSFNEHWQFTLGGRYTWEEKTIDQFNYVSAQDSLGAITGEEYRDLRYFTQPVVLADVPKFDDDESWTEFSPSATVTTFLPDDWTDGLLDSGMLYLTYSEGFKAGGFSDFGLDDPTIFEPETVKNYEFGFKLDLWDQRLRLNGALYHMDYDDIQLSVTRAFAPLDVRFGITNAGKAEIDGAELEVVLMPLEGLLINLTGSYVDASYNEFTDTFENLAGETITSDRKDEPFSYLPEQTYSWGIQYDLDTSFALITPRVSGYYKDKIYLGQDPESFEFEDDATLDDYTVWNARLAVLPHQLEGLEVSVFVDNFTDKTYYGSGIVNTANVGAVTGIRGIPRHWGVDFYYTW
jgi:iron complex outermembrane receptor protein